MSEPAKHLNTSPLPVVEPSPSPNPSSSTELTSGGTPCNSELIDNSTRSYRPVRLQCGVTVQVGENVSESCPGILHDINHDLIGCLSVLPASTRRLVRRTKIWINRTWEFHFWFSTPPTQYQYAVLSLHFSLSSYSYGSLNNPNVVRHTTAHHFAGWLLW